MKIKEIISATKGKLISGDPELDVKLSRISTDSRSLGKGEFFIALKGKNYDGSRFLRDAIDKGALGVLSAPCRFKSLRGMEKVIIHVEDPTSALQDIARSHRMKFGIPVIGVTGSSGKTTVKEMIWRVLSAKYKVLKNEGTKNNHIGVPLTLLKLEGYHEACVLELGTNHPGEIELLSGIARPDTAVITNVGPTHLEYLKDLRGVFKEKKDILKYISQEGCLIINGDDPLLSKMKTGKYEVQRYGFKRSNDFMASSALSGKGGVKFVLNGRHLFELKALGRHNVYNALAAIAVGRKLGISYRSIKASLSDHKPGDMRLVVKSIGGIEILDDCYNSNPSSMICALEALINFPARRKWVVVGDMLELGDRSERFHREIGGLIARSNVAGLLTYGKLSRHTSLQAGKGGIEASNLWHCRTHGEVAGVLKRVAGKGDAVLIKGSRGMRMEEIIILISR